MKGLNEFKNAFSATLAEKTINEEAGLAVTPSSTKDYSKLSDWIESSDFYAEEEDGYFFFPEDDVDALEDQLEKEFKKAKISVSYRAIDESLTNKGDVDKLNNYLDKDVSFKKEFLSWSKEEQILSIKMLKALKKI